MKKLLFLFLINTIAINIIFSQGVSINNSSSPSDPSAMLDVSGTTSGVLINRMTIAQRDVIPSPAEGLIIYNLDCHNLNVHSLGNWVNVNPEILPDVPTSGAHTPSET